MRWRDGISNAAVAALVAAPAASAAKPKLYRISLSGKAKSELTRTKTVYPQDSGCIGTVTRTYPSSRS
jgi:hypothetical protein